MREIRDTSLQRADDKTSLQHSLLAAIEADPSCPSRWSALLDTLLTADSVDHDVYTAVPRLVEHASTQALPVWHVASLITAVHLVKARQIARERGSFERWYAAAVDRLAHVILDAMGSTVSPQQNRGMLGLLAVWKGLNIDAVAMLEFSEEDLADFFMEPEEKDLLTSCKLCYA